MTSESDHFGQNLSDPNSHHAGLHSVPISFESPANHADRQSVDDPIREQIGPYRLTRQIGRGGMGVVYEAVDTRLKRRVAIKLLLNPSAADARGERFLREATSTARLTHPNIVQIHDVGHANGRDYIVMRYVEGVTLSEALRSRVFSYREIAKLMESVAIAVHFAHSQSVIHRDLKPANIMLAGGSPNGSSFPGSVDELPAVNLTYTPLVMDFGLAKDLTQGKTLSISGQLMGTPSYMPPEQAEGRTDSIGPACDVYALGATLYECLTGRPPFSGASPVQILEAVIKEDPVRPAVITPRVPRDLETICLKCLEKNPNRRYLSADALALDLRAWLAGDSIAARPRSWVYHAWRSCLKHPTTSVGVMLAMLGFLVTFALLLHTEHLKQQVYIDREKSRKFELQRNIATAKSSVEEAQIIIKFSGGLHNAPEGELLAALDFCERALREVPSSADAQELAQKISRTLFDRALNMKNWSTARNALSMVQRYAPVDVAVELMNALSSAEKKHYAELRNRVQELFEDAKSPSRKFSQELAVAELTSMRCDLVANEITLYLQGESPKCVGLALEALQWQGSKFAPVFQNWIKPILPNGLPNPPEFQRAALRAICLNDETKDSTLYKAVAQRISDEPGKFDSELYRNIEQYYVPYARRKSLEFNLKPDLPAEK